MTFQVYNGVRALYHTDSLEFIPSYETLQNMQQAGMTFRVNGAAISFTKLISWLSTQDRSYTRQHNHSDAATADQGINRQMFSVSPAKASTADAAEIASTDFAPSTASVGTSRVVCCVETGQTWDKQSKAAKALGIDPAAVSDSLKTGRKRSGYTFKWVEV